MIELLQRIVRYDGGTGTVAQSGRQPAVGMTHELKQSIKESAELIRTVNGDFSWLGEKLNECRDPSSACMDKR